MALRLSRQILQFLVAATDSFHTTACRPAHLTARKRSRLTGLRAVFRSRIHGDRLVAGKLKAEGGSHPHGCAPRLRMPSTGAWARPGLEASWHTCLEVAAPSLPVGAATLSCQLCASMQRWSANLYAPILRSRPCSALTSPALHTSGLRLLALDFATQTLPQSVLKLAVNDSVMESVKTSVPWSLLQLVKLMQQAPSV